MPTIRGIDALFDEIPSLQRSSPRKSRSNDTLKNTNTNPNRHVQNNSNNSDYEAIDQEFQPVRTIPNTSQTTLRVERALTQSNQNPRVEPFYHSQTTQSITSSSQSQSQHNKFKPGKHRCYTKSKFCAVSSFTRNAASS